MQRTWWPEAGTIIVTGPYWTLRNKLQWNYNWNSNIFIQENVLKMSCAKQWPFCLCLNVLRSKSPHLAEWFRFEFCSLLLNLRQCCLHRHRTQQRDVRWQTLPLHLLQVAVLLHRDQLQTTQRLLALRQLVSQVALWWRSAYNCSWGLLAGPANTVNVQHLSMLVQVMACSSLVPRYWLNLC